MTIAVWILLAAGLLTFLAMAIALLAVKDFYTRLHYLTPASTIGVVLVAAAVVTAESLSQAGIKAILIALVLIVTSPVISHATARAARIRQARQWQLLSEEEAAQESVRDRE